MGLLEGSMSAIRCRVESIDNEKWDPDAPFAACQFKPINLGSEIQVSAGFEHIRPDLKFKFGAQSYVWRLRVQTRAPDKNELRCAVEKEVQRRHQLRGKVNATEIEGVIYRAMLKKASPKTTFVEGVLLDGKWV